MRRWALQAGFFLDAVAARLGMGQGDFACLSLLHLEGPATPGHLAERTGLTTGAITGVVDRLERAGWVERHADPDDRRRVIVQAVRERGPEVAAVMAPMLAAAGAVQARFEPAELGVVAAYVREATVMLARETARLRGVAAGWSPPRPAGPPAWVGAGEPDGPDAGPGQVVRGGWAGWGGGWGWAGAPGGPGRGRGGRGRGGDERAAGGGWPIGDALSGSLRLAGSVGALTVSSGPLGEVLVEGSDGLATRVRRAGPEAVVSLDHVAGRRRRHGRTVILNDRIPWSVEVTGGASRLKLQLAGAEIRGVGIRGGASDVEIGLPRPGGVVPVRVSGGASNVRLERPAGVAVVVRARGGVGRLTLDGQEHRAAGGEAAVSGGPASAPDRYEVEVRGGASRITITAAPPG